MYSSFGEFFNALIRGEFGFYELWRFSVDMYTGFTKTGDMIEFWNYLMKILDPVYSIVPYVLIALCLVVAFFGKKLLPLLKFLACFYAGFVAGVYYIAPLITPIINVPQWIFGVVLGIVAAVLYRFIYILFYTVGITYCVYVLCYTGFYMRDGAEYTLTKSIVCLAIALVVLVICFIFIKYAEMLGTAILGGYLVSFIIRCAIFDYRTLEVLAGHPWLGAGVITAVIAIPAVIVQYVTRKRY